MGELPKDSALMAQLSSELMAEESVALTVAAVLERARKIVSDADDASLTVSRKKGFTTLGATSERAEAADSLQYSLGEGPCVEAAIAVDWLRSGDVAHDQRWPQWGPRAANEGISSLLSIRLAGNGAALGALNLYASEPGKFSDPEMIDIGLVYAVHATNALKSARLVAGLRTALDSRHAIGVAQGILMAKYSVSLDSAFHVMTRYSNNLNWKLADLAEYVVENHHLPPSPEPARD